MDDLKRLGYGGSAEIDGVQVLVTSGNLATAKTSTYLEPLSLQPSDETRSRVTHADGISAYSGTVSFDVTVDSLVLFALDKLLSRGYMFDVAIHDGEDPWKMVNCFATSIGLSGAAGGLITASVGFISPSGMVDATGMLNDFIREQVPYGYWYSGNVDVRDWNLSMTQAVTPVYTNEDVMTPRYLKIGLFEFTLSVTTYEQLHNYDEITIATDVFTLKGNTNAEGYNFTGVTDLGTYTHTFETAADFTIGSDDIIIS
jgi:hypothetical protein